jgi:hypothetical protein
MRGRPSVIPEGFRMERRLGALVGLAFLFATVPSGCIQMVGNDFDDDGVIYLFVASLFLFGAALERIAERARTPGPAWLERGYVLLVTGLFAVLYTCVALPSLLESAFFLDLVAVPAGAVAAVVFRVVLETRRLPAIVVAAAAMVSVPFGLPVTPSSAWWFAATAIFGVVCLLFLLPVLALVGARPAGPRPGWEAWAGTAVAGGLLGLARVWTAMIARDQVTGYVSMGEVYQVTQLLTTWWLFTLGPSVIERLWTPRSELSRWA